MKNYNRLKSIVAICLVFCFALATQIVNATDISKLSPHFKTQSPYGSGPFPAVLMLSGCSGFDNPKKS